MHLDLHYLLTFPDSTDEELSSADYEDTQTQFSLTFTDSEIEPDFQLLVPEQNFHIIPPMAGQYQNFNTSVKVRRFESASWFYVDVLISVLNQVKLTALETVQGRKDALNKINRLAVRMSKIPVAADMRFPDDREYICDRIGAWVNQLTSLRSNLSYPDRETEIS